MGRVEKFLFGGLVAMLVTVAAVAAYVLIDHGTRCSRFHFDPSEWRDPNAHRNEMANRLVDCHRLDGWRSAEVLQRLGRPNERYRLHPAGTVYWSYPAGHATDFLFETYETLDIEMSQRGWVHRARIVELSPVD
jgi:hypothetical protein